MHAAMIRPGNILNIQAETLIKIKTFCERFISRLKEVSILLTQNSI
jgi:NADH:ubiquinone oxidoreductase subunit D